MTHAVIVTDAILPTGIIKSIRSAADDHIDALDDKLILQEPSVNSPRRAARVGARPPNPDDLAAVVEDHERRALLRAVRETQRSHSEHHAECVRAFPLGMADVVFAPDVTDFVRCVLVDADARGFGGCAGALREDALGVWARGWGCADG